MEDAALIRQRLAALADTLLTGAQGAEIFHRLGHGLAEETHHDAACMLKTNNVHSWSREGGLVALGGSRHNALAYLETEEYVKAQKLRTCFLAIDLNIEINTVGDLRSLLGSLIIAGLRTQDERTERHDSEHLHLRCLDYEHKNEMRINQQHPRLVDGHFA